MLVVAAVSLMLCLLLFSSVVFSFCQQVSKQIVCFFFLFFLLFFFSLLSLTIPHSPFFSLSLPLLCWLSPQLFFFFFFFFFFSPLLSLSCFLCPLVLSIIVWLNKRIYKIKLINKKKKKKAVNDDSIVTHTYCHVLSVLLTGQKKKKKDIRKSLL